MTTDTNSERAAAIFEAFGRGDVAFIVDQLTPDARFTAHLDPVVPWAGEFSGPAGVSRFFTAMGSAVEVTGHPVHRLVAQDDTVVATGDVSFRVRQGGREGSSKWVYIFTLEDGKLRSYDQFNDTGLADAFR